MKTEVCICEMCMTSQGHNDEKKCLTVRMFIGHLVFLKVYFQAKVNTGERFGVMK